MSRTTTKLNRHNWPIAAAMIQYPNILPDGSSVQDQSPEGWAATLADVTDAGFTEIDPTDSWLRLADLSPARLDTFLGLIRDAGLTIPAISTSRRSVIDPERGDEFLEYCHRVLDTAAKIGAKEVSFGLFYPLNEAQKKALWFWTAQGYSSPDDPATWKKAVERIRELGRHAEEVGVGISLEMYEDTYLGSAESAVRFVQDVDHPSVGLNADLGNLVRLHRPVEHWASMMEKVAPFARYWHAKNYFRTEDATTGMIVTAPAPLEFGVISYRAAIRMALAHGFQSAFLCEHYGGDGLSVSATNREYLRRILPQ
ncbi:sugar phosphate isomerase/epimerase family protein [Brytella acorum]|uniref:Sugar phosphate isomerase/epimerase n=1 Tax=Brytella acorum TaxID=2959299 RepID=A0AA35V9R7_9PROT|nr:sugar phosphate isomerase/epimerase family protein [Brytella acorum]MDF3625497.1 sugar phosphate isomerase/epimerase [Brytella acorum]CAI9120350.1 sugar phosphate isomerase/epimerase [Brytella acorum]